MSNFFIRNPSSKPNGVLKRKAKKPKVHYAKKEKKSILKPTTHLDDEEIPSDEEEINFNDHGKESEEEVLTAQEKKLQLAQKYLKEIEEQEKTKLENDEALNEVVLDRLKEDVLVEAGKFKKKLLENFNKEINEENIKVLKCKEHKLPITVVILSSDCKYIYSGSKDGSIVKWTIDGSKVKCLPPRHKDKSNEKLHSSSILAIAVSEDDKYLASSDEGRVIQIWEADTFNHYHSFLGHQASVTGLAFCKITQNLYSCSKDKTVKVWSMNEKAYIETLFGHHDCITGIDVLCKGRAVTAGGTDSTCRVWKIEEETQLIYNGNSRSIDSVKRLDDAHFVSCSEDGSLCLWGTLKKKPLAKVESAHGFDPLSGEPYWISSVACVPNSEIFASGSNDGNVRFWNCADNYRNFTEFYSIPVKGFINSMVFSPNNNYLVLGVGQEHKLGRWSKVKEAKNCVVVINNLLTTTS
ncbi:U3 small nucleolar RNA-interacting protein 2 [Halyomorpha halys]|uniref:U3 small nucleolar RNA-interacting protein 2 n=1 Tax=Halyomorpha halys TaxID=286706 RepID=UPI0006D505D1|nr:U3 small nucleolar RNA-interacting protein 2 [Halyomorpha halys]